MQIASILIQYLRRPIFTSQREPFGRKALRELTQLWALTLGLAVLTVLVSNSIYMLIKGKPAEAAEGFTELTQSSQFLFIAIIFAPLVEEVLFRSWLAHVRGILLAMPIFACLATILAINRQNNPDSLLTLMACGIILTAFAVYTRRYRQTYNRPHHHAAAVQHIFPYVFWAAAIVFALIHIGNYSSDHFDPAVVLLAAPQFMIGLILGFVRMRYGLLAAIGLHGAYNSVFAGLTVFTLNISAVLF